MSRAKIRGSSLAWRFAGLLAGTLFAVSPANAGQGLSQISLLHTATPGDQGNIVLDWTYLDHPLLNGNPEAVILVTHNISGGNVVYNENEIGVWYDTLGKQQWTIFHLNGSAMIENATFNVLVLQHDDADVFVHTSFLVNIDGNSTYLSHPQINGNPEALVFVTHNRNPSGVIPGVINDHVIGVYYDPFLAGGRWAIFNQDLAAMPENASFNVLVVDPMADNAFSTLAQPNMIVPELTGLDHPTTNDQPGAMLLLTQSWNPQGGLGVYNDEVVGVGYDILEGAWFIINESKNNMPDEAGFNVLSAPFFADGFESDDVSWWSSTVP